ncbi:Hypothetical protein HVR_LOCUS311 [uncultured virus]|nr:Hypothetical protein HVR_LOCUS311 [uncultured virus]
MDQKTNISPIKPLTLTILPQIPVVGCTNPISQHNIAQIPNFQYAPISTQMMNGVLQSKVPPVKVTQPSRGLTAEEKLERLRKSNLESQKKFQQKVKPYGALAHLSTINQQIKQLLILKYPDIINLIDPMMLDVIIEQFVNSIHSLTVRNQD